LNAKKIDINFDNEDFFNSFEPTNVNINKTVSLGAPAHEKLVNSNQPGKFVSKLQEVDD
jgi:hypothetical protein